MSSESDCPNPRRGRNKSDNIKSSELFIILWHTTYLYKISYIVQAPNLANINRIENSQRFS